MTAYDYDLFVIGAGSGGVRAARVSAALGAKVAIAEERHLGGTCVNAGCVPKKLFAYGAHFGEDFDDARNFGWRSAAPAFDWRTLRDNKTREVERLGAVYRRLLEDSGVALFEARAVIANTPGARAVRAGGRTVTARHILVATGSWPRVPDFPGSDLVITSNEAFHLPRFPDRALVLGGGYIAVEFAGIFAGLGARTTLAYRGDLLLRGFDEGVRRRVVEEMRERGVDVRMPARVAAVELIGRGPARRCVFADGTVVEADLVLAATGRAPASGDLGLASAGVRRAADGAIPVDEQYRTNVPHILAVGDVIGRAQLTPVAIAEGACVAHNLFGEGGGDGDGDGVQRVDYATIPTAVFCQPNIASVGPTEAEARRRIANLRVYESIFRPLKHTLSGRRERSLMKLLVDGDNDRVVAAHMCGADAGEIIQGVAVAINAGATKRHFDATIAIHPTAAEEFVTMGEPVR